MTKSKIWQIVWILLFVGFVACFAFSACGDSRKGMKIEIEENEVVTLDENGDYNLSLVYEKDGSGNLTEKAIATFFVKVTGGDSSVDRSVVASSSGNAVAVDTVFDSLTQKTKVKITASAPTSSNKSAFVTLMAKEDNTKTLKVFVKVDQVASTMAYSNAVKIESNQTFDQITNMAIIKGVKFQFSTDILFKFGPTGSVMPDIVYCIGEKEYQNGDFYEYLEEDDKGDVIEISTYQKTDPTNEAFKKNFRLAVLPNLDASEFHVLNSNDTTFYELQDNLPSTLEGYVGFYISQGGSFALVTKDSLENMGIKVGETQVYVRGLTKLTLVNNHTKQDNKISLEIESDSVNLDLLNFDFDYDLKKLEKNESEDANKFELVGLLDGETTVEIEMTYKGILNSPVVTKTLEVKILKYAKDILLNQISQQYTESLPESSLPTSYYGHYYREGNSSYYSYALITEDNWSDLVNSKTITPGITPIYDKTPYNLVVFSEYAEGIDGADLFVELLDFSEGCGAFELAFDMTKQAQYTNVANLASQITIVDKESKQSYKLIDEQNIWQTLEFESGTTLVISFEGKDLGYLPLVVRAKNMVQSQSVEREILVKLSSGITSIALDDSVLQYDNYVPLTISNADGEMIKRSKSIKLKVRPFENDELIDTDELASYLTATSSNTKVVSTGKVYGDKTDKTVEFTITPEGVTQDGRGDADVIITSINGVSFKFKVATFMVMEKATLTVNTKFSDSNVLHGDREQEAKGESLSWMKIEQNKQAYFNVNLYPANAGLSDIRFSSATYNDETGQYEATEQEPQFATFQSYTDDRLILLNALDASGTEIVCVSFDYQVFDEDEKEFKTQTAQVFFELTVYVAISKFGIGENFSQEEEITLYYSKGTSDTDSSKFVYRKDQSTQKLAVNINPNYSTVQAKDVEWYISSDSQKLLSVQGLKIDEAQSDSNGKKDGSSFFGSYVTVVASQPAQTSATFNIVAKIVDINDVSYSVTFTILVTQFNLVGSVNLNNYDETEGIYFETTKGLANISNDDRLASKNNQSGANDDIGNNIVQYIYAKAGYVGSQIPTNQNLSYVLFDADENWEPTGHAKQYSSSSVWLGFDYATGQYFVTPISAGRTVIYILPQDSLVTLESEITSFDELNKSLSNGNQTISWKTVRVTVADGYKTFFRLYDGEDVKDITTNPDSWDKNYYVMNDIDMTGFCDGWSPIGNSSIPFTGSLTSMPDLRTTLEFVFDSTTFYIYDNQVFDSNKLNSSVAKVFQNASGENCFELNGTAFKYNGTLLVAEESGEEFSLKSKTISLAQTYTIYGISFENTKLQKGSSSFGFFGEFSGKLSNLAFNFDQSVFGTDENPFVVSSNANVGLLIGNLLDNAKFTPTTLDGYVGKYVIRDGSFVVVDETEAQNLFTTKSEVYELSSFQNISVNTTVSACFEKDSSIAQNVTVNFGVIGQNNSTRFSGLEVLMTASFKQSKSYVFVNFGSAIGKNNADTQNIKVSSLNVSVEKESVGNNSSFGGVVGNNSAALSNLECEGKIDVNSYVNLNYLGGIVGRTNASLSNCVSAVKLCDALYVGGIVGYVTGTVSLSHCIYQIFEKGFALKSTKASGAVGGLVGFASDVKIGYSYVISYVELSSNAEEIEIVGAQNASAFTGGLVGKGNSISLENSFAIVSISGAKVGGFVGYGGIVKIKNCFVRGEIKGSSEQASLFVAEVGNATDSIVEKCYSVLVPDEPLKTVGNAQVLCSYCYVLDGTTSETTGMVNILDGEEMQIADSFVGFNFYNQDSKTGDWIMPTTTGKKYPLLYDKEKGATLYPTIPSSLNFHVSSKEWSEGILKVSENEIIINRAIFSGEKAFNEIVEVSIEPQSLADELASVPISIMLANGSVVNILHPNLSNLSFTIKGNGTETIVVTCRQNSAVFAVLKICVVEGFDKFKIYSSQGAKDDEEAQTTESSQPDLSMKTGEDNSRAIRNNITENWYVSFYNKNDSTGFSASGNLGGGVAFAVKEGFVKIGKDIFENVQIGEQTFSRAEIMEQILKDHNTSEMQTEFLNLFGERGKVVAEGIGSLGWYLDFYVDNYWFARVFEENVGQTTQVVYNAIFYAENVSNVEVSTFGLTNGKITVTAIPFLKGTFAKTQGNTISKDYENKIVLDFGLAQEYYLSIYAGVKELKVKDGNSDEDAPHVFNSADAFPFEVTLVSDSELDKKAGVELELLVMKENSSWQKVLTKQIDFNEVTQEIQTKIVCEDGFENKYDFSMGEIRVDESSNSIFQKFTFQISQSYRYELTDNQKFKIVLKNHAFEDGIDQISETIWFEVEPQSLTQSPELAHFADAELTANDGTNVGGILRNAGSSPTNQIIAGEYGLLRVSLSPDYAMFDRVEITSDKQNGDIISFQQRVASYVVENGQNVTNYYLYESGVAPITNGIVASRVSNCIYNAETDSFDNVWFDGNLYFQTLIASTTVSAQNFTIHVAVYFRDKLVGENSLEVAVDSSLSLVWNYDTVMVSDINSVVPTAYVAIGTGGVKTQPTSAELKDNPSLVNWQSTQNVFSLKKAGDFQNVSVATFDSVLDKNGKKLLGETRSKFLSDFKLDRTTNSSGLDEYYLTVPKFSTDKASEDYFENYLGYTITLTVSGFKYVNNIKRTIHRNINVVLVDFVLQEGAFYVKYGTDTTLSDDATPNSIDLPYFKNAFYKIEVGIDKTKVIGNLELVGSKIDEFVSILNLSPYEVGVDDEQTHYALKDFASNVGDGNFAKQMWFIKEETQNTAFLPVKVNQTLGANDLVFDVETAFANFNTNKASTVSDRYTMHALLLEDNTSSSERGYYIHPINRTTGTESLSLCLDDFYFAYKNGRFTLQNSTFFQFDATVDSGYRGYETVVQTPTANTFTVPSISFNLTFSQQTSVDSPIPIYDENGFLNEIQEGKHYRLMADLDFSDITKYPNYTPLDVAFASFDGNGHTITLCKNFNTTAVSSNEGNETNPANFGLFKKIYAGSVVKNLTLVCPSDGEVKVDLSEFQYANFGVLAGTNLGSIHNCEVKNFEKEGQTTNTNGVVSVLTSSNLNSSTYVGGLVGQNLEGSLTDSLNNVGQISNSRIKNVNLVATGTALGNNFGSAVLGGFVGQNNGHIASSYVDFGIVRNNSILLGTAMTGGFVGVNKGIIMTSHVGTGYVVEFGGTQTPKVTQTLKSNVNAGGFVVLNDGDISDCFSAVDMTDNVSEELAVSSDAVSGGFVCTNDSSGTITRSYSVSHLPKNNRAHTPFVGPNKQDNFQSLNNLNENGITESAFLDINFGKESVKLTENIGILNYDIGLFINKGNRNMDAWEYFGVSRNSETDSIMLLEITNNWVFANSDDTNKLFTTTKLLGQNLIEAENNSINSENNPTISVLGPQLVSAHLVATEGWDEVVYSTQEAKYIYGNRIHRSTGEILTYKANIINEGLVVGPRVISSAEEFYNNLVDDFKDGILDDWYRLVSNIDLNDLVEKGIDISIFGTQTFAGRIEGNGFKINSIDLSARKDVETPIVDERGKKLSTFGLFGQILTKQSDDGSFEGYTYASITNLELGVIAVRASLVNYVGSLAGYANNVVVSGVTLTAKNTANVHVIGRNMAGGLFGKLVGKSQVFNVTSDLSVSAVFGNSESNTYTYNRDLLNLYSYSEGDLPTLLKDTIVLGTFSDVSLCYAGGILGVSDLTPFGKELLVLSHSYFSEVKLTSLKVTGTSKTVGTVAGGVVGLLGASSQASDLWKITEDGAYIKGSRFAGGVVGENHGVLNYARITYKQEIQDVVDASTYVGTVSSAESFSSFQGSSYAIGGVVGINIGIANGSQAGTIKNSFSKVRVVNTMSKVAGGIVGVAVGGQFDSNFATGSVLSSATGTTGGAFGGILTFNDLDLQKVLTSPFSTIKNNQFTINIENTETNNSATYTVVLTYEGSVPTVALINNKSYKVVEKSYNRDNLNFKYYNIDIDNAELRDKCCIFENEIYFSEDLIVAQLTKTDNKNYYATKINQWSYVGMTYQVARINRIVAKNNWSFSDYSKLANIQTNGHLGGFIGRTTQNTSDYPLEYDNLLSKTGHSSVESDDVYDAEFFKTGKVKQSQEKNFYVSKVFASQQSVSSSSGTVTALNLNVVGDKDTSSVLITKDKGSSFEYVDIASGLTRNSMYNFSYNKSKTYDRMFESWSIYDYGTQINENSTKLSDYKLTNYDAYGMPIYDPIVGFTKIQITTTDEWLAMNENPDADYQLMNDLDFSGVDNYNSIGNSNDGTVFTGSLTGLVEDDEGNPIINTIYNIDLTESNNGLWGITNGAVIENLNVVGITGHDYKGTTANAFGLLIGTATDTTIRNITIKKDNAFVISSQNTNELFEVGGKLYERKDGQINLIAEAPATIEIQADDETVVATFKQTDSFFDVTSAIKSPKTYYVSEHGEQSKVYFTSNQATDTKVVYTASSVTNTSGRLTIKIDTTSGEQDFIIFQGKLFKEVAKKSICNVTGEGAFEIDDVKFKFDDKLVVQTESNSNNFAIDDTTCFVETNSDGNLVIKAYVGASKKEIAKVDENSQFLYNNKYYIITQYSNIFSISMKQVVMTQAKNQIDLKFSEENNARQSFATGGLVGQYIGNSCVDTKGEEVELKNLVVDADIYVDIANTQSVTTGGLFGSINANASNSGNPLKIKQGFYAGIMETTSTSNTASKIKQGGIAGTSQGTNMESVVADVTMYAKLFSGAEASYVGGIVGYGSGTDTEFTNIVVLGDIVVDVVSEQSSSFYVGGVVGWAIANISNVVNAPNIIINTLDTSTDAGSRWNVNYTRKERAQYVGGIAGEIAGKVSNTESVASIMNYTTLKDVNALFGHIVYDADNNYATNCVGGVVFDKQVALVTQESVKVGNIQFDANNYALSTNGVIATLKNNDVFAQGKGTAWSYPILRLDLFDDPTEVECVMKDETGASTYNFLEKYIQVVVNAEEGTKLNPKEIKDKDDFVKNISGEDYAYYIQTANITGVDISQEDFVGFYNGNGFEINGAIVSDLYGRTVKSAGLFGTLKSSEEIHTASTRNITSENPTHTMFSYYRGTIIAALNANYEKFAVKNNKVSEFVSAGILTGTIDSHGIVYGCVTSGNIILNGTLTQSNAIGGIAGRNLGQIVASGSSADVWANGGTVEGNIRKVYVGGLAGVVMGYDNIYNTNGFDLSNNSNSKNPIKKPSDNKIQNSTVYAVSNSFFTGTIRFGQVGQFVAGGIAGGISVGAEKDTFGENTSNGKTYLENSYVSAIAVVKQDANNYEIYESGDSPTKGTITASSIVGSAGQIYNSNSDSLTTSFTKNLWFDTNLQNENVLKEGKDSATGAVRFQTEKQMAKGVVSKNDDDNESGTQNPEVQAMVCDDFYWQANIGYNFGLCTPGIVANMGQNTGIGTESSPFLVKNPAHLAWALNQDKKLLDKVFNSTTDAEAKAKAEANLYPYIKMGIDLNYAQVNVRSQNLSGNELSKIVFGGYLNGNGFYIQNSNNPLVDINNGWIAKLGFKNGNTSCYVANTNNANISEVYIQNDGDKSIFFESGEGSLINSLTNNGRSDHKGMFYGTTTISYSGVYALVKNNVEDLFEVWYVKHQSGNVDDNTSTGTFVLRAFDKNASEYDVFGIIGTDNYAYSAETTLSDEWETPNSNDTKGTIYITTKEQYIALVQYYQENDKVSFKPYNIFIAKDIDMEGIELSHLGTYFAGQDNGIKQTHIYGKIEDDSTTHTIKNFGLTNDSLIKVFEGEVKDLNISNVSIIANKNSAVLFKESSNTQTENKKAVTNVEISHVLANVKFADLTSNPGEGKEGEFARFGIVADTSLANLTNTLVKNSQINVFNTSEQEAFVGGLVAINQITAVNSASDSSINANESTMIYGNINNSGVRDVLINVDDEKSDEDTQGVIVGGLVGQNCANINAQNTTEQTENANGVANTNILGNAKSIGLVVGMNNGSGKVVVSGSVENSTIQANAINAGGIFGEIRAISGGIILKDTAGVDLTISSAITNVGGIAGIYKVASGIVTTVNGNIKLGHTNTATIKNLGGIAGQIMAGTSEGTSGYAVGITITKDTTKQTSVYPTIEINSNATNVGGLVGLQSDDTHTFNYVVETNINIISNKFKDEDDDNVGVSVGGLFGKNTGRIGTQAGSNDERTSSLKYGDGEGGNIYKMEISGQATYIGGIVGYNSNWLYASLNNLKIDTETADENKPDNYTRYVGGLVGFADTGSKVMGDDVRNIQITASSSRTGDEYVGGLVGYNNQGAWILTSVLYNSTLKGNQYVGGITGKNVGAIYGLSVATSDAVHADSITIEGNKYLGAITGENESRNNDYSTISKNADQSIIYDENISGYIENVVVRDIYNLSAVKSDSASTSDTSENDTSTATSKSIPMNITFNSTTQEDGEGQGILVSVNKKYAVLNGVYVGLSCAEKDGTNTFTFADGNPSQKLYSYNMGFVGLNEGKVRNLGINVSAEANTPQTDEDDTTQTETGTETDTSITANETSSAVKVNFLAANGKNVGIIGRSTSTSVVEVIQISGNSAFEIAGNENVGVIGYCETNVVGVDSIFNIFKPNETLEQPGLGLANVTFTGNTNVGAVGYVKLQDTSTTANSDKETYNMDIEINDLVVINLSEETGNKNAGLVGKMDSDVKFKFKNDSVLQVNGHTNVGGLVGYAGGNISGRIELPNKERSAITINGNMGQQTTDKISDLELAGENIGGFVGQLAPNFVFKPTELTFAEKNDKTFLNVYGFKNVGGIIGFNRGSLSLPNSEIKKVQVIGNTNVGGVVGENQCLEKDNIEDEAIKGGFSIYAPTVYGNTNVGGIAGINHGLIGSGANISNSSTISMSSMKVSGTTTDSHCIGGLVGLNIGKVYYCNVEQGSVCGTEGSKAEEWCKGGYRVGGLVGDNQGTIYTPQMTETKIYGYRLVGGAVGYNENGASLLHPRFEYKGDQNDVDNGDSVEVQGHHNVGGLAGVNGGEIVSSLTINDGTNGEKDNILYVFINTPYTNEGTYNFGGIAGVNLKSGVVSNVLINSRIYSADTLVGGFFGSNYAPISNFSSLRINNKGSSLYWGGIKAASDSNLIYKTKEEFYKSIYMYYTYGDNMDFILNDNYQTDERTPMGVSSFASGNKVTAFEGSQNIPEALWEYYNSSGNKPYANHAIVGMHIGYDAGGITCFYEGGGATVSYENNKDEKQNVRIVGAVQADICTNGSTALIKLTLSNFPEGIKKDLIKEWKAEQGYNAGDYVRYGNTIFYVGSAVSESDNRDNASWEALLNGGKITIAVTGVEFRWTIFTNFNAIISSTDFVGFPATIKGSIDN